MNRDEQQVVIQSIGRDTQFTQDEMNLMLDYYDHNLVIQRRIA